MKRCGSLMAVLCVLAGCGGMSVDPGELKRIENSNDYIQVTGLRFREDKGEQTSIGLDAGRYMLEYETKDGRYYRGPGLSVKLPGGLNFNKALYPENMFEGGVYISKDPGAKDYRIYYYQNNLPGSPRPETIGVRELQMEDMVNRGTPGSNPTVPSTGTSIGTGIGLGITDAIAESGRGKIVVFREWSEINLKEHVSKP